MQTTYIHDNRFDFKSIRSIAVRIVNIQQMIHTFVNNKQSRDYSRWILFELKYRQSARYLFEFIHESIVIVDRLNRIFSR
jgi:hypothetical protein